VLLSPWITKYIAYTREYFRLKETKKPRYLRAHNRATCFLSCVTIRSNILSSRLSPKNMHIRMYITCKCKCVKRECTGTDSSALIGPHSGWEIRVESYFPRSRSRILPGYCFREYEKNDATPTTLTPSNRKRDNSGYNVFTFMVKRDGIPAGRVRSEKRDFTLPLAMDRRAWWKTS